MNNTLTAEQCLNLGINEKYIGAKYRYQYQKTGGIIVCKSCGRFLGFPTTNGDVIGKQDFSKLFDMGCEPVIKYAVNKTNVNTKTKIILTTVDGEVTTTSIKLNKED